MKRYQLVFVGYDGDEEEFNNRLQCLEDVLRLKTISFDTHGGTAVVRRTPRSGMAGEITQDEVDECDGAWLVEDFEDPAEAVDLGGSE